MSQSKMTIDEFVSHDSGEVIKLKAKVKELESKLKLAVETLEHYSTGLLHPNKAENALKSIDSWIELKSDCELG